jgi:hypothetical protein
LALSHRRVAPLLAVLTVAYRVPELLVAERLINSDVAVVGLQAMAMLRGEFSGLLWGTGYQGVIEPLLTVPLLALFPDRPALALSLMSVVGHLALVLAVYALVARPLGPARGALVAATIAFGPSQLHNLSLAAPRVWALALVLLALAAFEQALATEQRSRRASWSAVGGLLVGLGYYSDLFVVLMLPGVGLYLLLAALWAAGAARWTLLAAATFGFGVGSIPRVALGMSAGSVRENLHLERLASNWDLLGVCLSRLLGWTNFAAEHGALRGAIAAVAIAVFAALLLAGATLAPRSPEPERRLAACGLGWVGTCLVLFVVTGRALDDGSARYLSPLLLGFPLLLPAVLRAVAARRLERPALAAVGAVALFFAAEGRAQFAPELAAPRDPRSRTPDEDALRAVLEQHQVKAVLAEYWAAYRLTFLWKEALIVVDGDASRRKEYREALLRAPRFAVLFGRAPHPEAPLADWQDALTRRGVVHHTGVAGGYQYLAVEGPTQGISLAHQLEVTRAPSTLKPGERGTVSLRARNTGDFPWRADTVHAAYHLLDARGFTTLYDGERTLLPRDIAPGEVVDLEVAVVAPSQPGQHQVELDLVAERVCWFADRGSKTRSFALTVAP